MKVYTENEVNKLIKSVQKILNDNGLGCNAEVYEQIYKPDHIDVILHGEEINPIKTKSDG